MKENRASLKFRVTVFVLTAAMIIFAFVHSSMPAEVSDGESLFILELIYKFFGLFGISSDISNHIIRKLAHFTEFGVIGALLMSCAYSFDRIKPYRFYAQILFTGLAVAVCDETIQLGSAGRSGQITDVLLDFSGVVTGAVILLLFYTVYRKAKKFDKGY